jgi:signal peptidase I
MDAPCPARRRIASQMTAWAVLCGVALLVVDGWILSGVLRPIRVAGGSMAPAMLGPHRVLSCPACGFSFAVELDAGLPSTPAERGSAPCPNCGFAVSDPASCQQPGQRLFVDRATPALRQPRRWEPIVFRSPIDGHLAVKRVVGLPGETVRIVGGQLQIADRPVAKSLSELRRTAILVHDQNHPAAKNSLPSRWRGESGATAWRETGCGHFSCSLPDADSATDWLVYEHWTRTPGRPNRATPGPILDDTAYNPRQSRELFVVYDLLLSFRAELSSPGTAVVRATDARDAFEARISVDRPAESSPHVEVTLARDGKPVERRRVAAALGKTIAVEWMFAHCRVALGLDGRVLLVHDYDPDKRPRQPTSRPLAIGCRRGSLRVWDVRVYRDVYYVAPRPGDAVRDVTSPVTVPPACYYVLGDNSSLSQDSRTWPEVFVQEKWIVGRALRAAGGGP